jgi:UDP-N-acetylmuramate dehydrogenase
MKVVITGDFNGRVRYDEPMSTHTSWHAGGPADVFFTPRDAEDLVTFLRMLPAEIPVYWVGLGSNLLVRDGGVRGVIVSTPGAFTRIERRSQTRIYVEASVPCARVARSCQNWGLSQSEFLGGIPGTLGGALAMNAGSFGDETWRHVVTIESIDRRGARRTRARDEFKVNYRSVEWPSSELQEWFLSAELQFEPRTPAQTPTVQSLLQRRRETQPTGDWSCGSVFKNPPGDHAARLIEAAGLKGFRIGDAVVSEKHANFIVNEGKAHASELEKLIVHIRDTVQEVYNITLEPEVRIIGEHLATPVSASAASTSSNLDSPSISNGGRC